MWYWFRTNFFHTCQRAVDSNNLKSNGTMVVVAASGCLYACGLVFYLPPCFYYIILTIFWNCHPLDCPNLVLPENIFSVSVLGNLQWSLSSSCEVTPLTLRLSYIFHILQSLLNWEMYAFVWIWSIFIRIAKGRYTLCSRIQNKGC